MISIRHLLPVMLAALGVACDRYVVTLNENEIHTPPPAFIAQALHDPGLIKCVEKNFSRQDITQPEQLTALDCHDANILSLDGMEVFTRLTAVDLSSNPIQDPRPLFALEQLKRVNLLNNPKLDCEHVRMLAEQGVMVVHPQHCTR